VAALDLLTRNAVDVLPAGELERRLARAEAEGRPLRVKLGIDPTAPVVTLGHTVVLGALRAFQDAGHTAVLIVGDYTARVGDPSGRSKTRPMLTPEEIEHNVAVQLEEYGLVIDIERAEVRRNSEWLAPLGTAGLLELAARTTVARLLERDDFAKRHAAREPISLQELLYPLLQGWDSVAIEADVELGGTDQRFNLLMGRDLQEAVGQTPQIVLTLPLLVGTDGVQKMSKSVGNVVGLRDEPDLMYGRVMSLPDAAMPEWFRLVSGIPPERAPELLDGLQPVEAKRLLARSIVERFHGADAGAAAEEEFLRVHRRRELPTEIPEAALPEGEPVYLPGLLVQALGVASSSEARRLIAGGGVKIDGEATDALEVPRSALLGRVVQVGRRRFARFVDGSAVPP
jgi:tyrosyl-tRNA synthetase